MYWIDQALDSLTEGKDENYDFLISSGVSPSGTYHLGTLREVLTAEAISRGLKSRGLKSRHVHVVDDLDVFRKVPVDVPDDFEKYLGRPLCDVPSPNEGQGSYADYFLNDLLEAASELHLDMEIVRANQKYREGYFVEAIEIALENVDKIRTILEQISGRKLDNDWSPIQVIENGYLKNRKFISIDKEKKDIKYQDNNGNEFETRYDDGNVKLSWRVDWPARWWMLGVDAEPFGRDHATKGGSYDTGKSIVSKVYGGNAPLPIPYNFINKTGDTKKMSKSAGDTVTASELLKILPAEVVWFFILRYSPDKLLFFDTDETLVRLIDEFAALLAKNDKTEEENRLVAMCMYGVEAATITNIPFSHLVASYQASLKDSQNTIEIIMRTEHKETAVVDREVIIRELKFIDNWLENWAPEELKFSLKEDCDAKQFSQTEIKYFNKLADKIESAEEDTDGEWFHLAIYSFKEELGLQPKELFTSLYRLIIGKDYGPRAGWFLSILPRDWLIKRLRLEN